MGQFAEYIASTAKMGLGLSEAMLKEVTPEMFARKPVISGKVIDTNHAAFIYGHLALYPSRWLTVCGLDGTKIAAPAGFDELFAAGKECKDDPTGTIYPPMKTITDAFFSAHRAAIELLPTVADSVFAQPNPREQMRGRLPTIGSTIIFYASTHFMMHIGQTSTWRRCFGLASVM
jgi:hypothetical protein